MKITIKIGKKSRDLKIMSEKDARKVAIIVNGDLLKEKLFPGANLDKVTYKIDGEKIKPSELLMVMKKILKNQESGSKKTKDSSKKDKAKSKKKKDKKKKDSNKKSKESNKKSTKKKDKSKKEVSINFDKSKQDDAPTGTIKLTRIRHYA